MGAYKGDLFLGLVLHCDLIRGQDLGLWSGDDGLGSATFAEHTDG